MHFRHFKLSEPEQRGQVIRLLSGVVEPPGDSPTSWVTVTRVGSFTDPRYGRFEITRDMLLGMVRSFDAGLPGTDIFLDLNHEPGEGGAATIRKLKVEGGKLRALAEWTSYGRDAVKNKAFRYLSAEFSENWQDNEQGQYHGPVLLGAGLTLRPVIKGLDPVLLSEPGADIPMLLHPELARTLLSEAKTTMEKWLKDLLAALAAKQLSQPAIDAIKTLAETQLATVTDEAQAKQLCDQLQQAAIQLSEQLGKLPANGPAPVIQLSVGGLDHAAVGAAVAKALAERDTAAKQLSETIASRRKLLSETIQAAAGLDDDAKKALAEAALPLVHAGMDETQVRALAQMQIDQGNQLIAARQLSAMGYRVTGSPHITVPAEGTRKLSEIYRENLAKTTESGKLRLLPDDKIHPFCARVLAEFDRMHGVQLDAEYKVLSMGQGTTDMGSTQLPFGVQREVIRQALSDLNVMQLVQTLTEFGAQATTQIPYEVRDMSKVVNDGIVYEGQRIPFAGVSQKMDTVFITPMKLALSITNEVLHFTRASVINWDALGRNIEMNGRILRELVARRICNELQRASDSYAALLVANENITASLNGAKSTFKTASFPVVRPYQARDLQGNPIGAAENPITITLNSNVISQWDGTGTQAVGTYWSVVSYNQGIFQWVDQNGAPVTPANTGTNTISYSRATNFVLFDMDIPANAPSTMTPERWLNGLLQKIGSRKAMMDGQRFIKPDFLLMSPVLNDTCTNAEQFVRQYERNGANTDDNGDLERVKGIATWGTNAPGVDLGDERILIGQRGVGAYSIAKPFITGEPVEVLQGGQPIGEKVAYGEEYNAITVPKPVRNRFTSVVAYSSSARAAL